MKRIVIEHGWTVWKVSCFAARHGLIFYDKIPMGPENAEEVIWISEDARIRLHRMDDPFCGLAYLLIEEADSGLVARAEEELDGLSLEVLTLALGGGDPAAVSPPSIAALGVLAPQVFDPVVFDLFSRLFAHEDADVRAAAVSAAAYPAWPELVPPFERLAAADPDEEVRRRAGIGARALAARG